MAQVRSNDGIDLAYEVHGEVGEGPAVVLVHGWAGNRTYWIGQVAALAADRQVITLDLGGHGESGTGRAEWTLPAFGEDVVAVVDEVGPERVILVGHSMGGDAIVHAARRLGERVVGLVWVDAFRSLGNEQPSTAEQVAAFEAPFRQDFPAAVERFARGMFPAGADPGLVRRVATDMAAEPWDAKQGSIGRALNREPALLSTLADLTVPVVAINPDIGPTDVESLRAHGIESVVVVPGVGHFLMLEQPDRFSVLLRGALDSIDTAGARRATRESDEC